MRARESLYERLDRLSLPEPNSGCWLWLGQIRGASGYGAITIKNKVCSAHRVSYEVHCGPIPHGMFVCHRCDNRICVNPYHLFLGTPAENMADMISKGRQRNAVGSRHGRAKLTAADVIAIRAATGITHQSLADRYGVSRQQVSRICSRGNWNHHGV